ncbi:MAG: exodeoxyribonuclease V subunit alpha [Candidatus Thiodiazotropha sp. (ex Notomyrtea botanica)]|nr:exodeoxyribonuclease V subunit alpha [Candidatus Thiodiazotropha sp. (ex Notomyrtea botanica)]
MRSPETLLRGLLDHKLISDLDLHFALFILVESPRPSEALALAAALTCHATGEGHVCFTLPVHAGQQLFQASPIVVDIPSLEVWRGLLLESGVVGRPGEWQPLILDPSDRLYLHRYWDYEQRLGQAIRSKADGLVEEIDEKQLATDIRHLFDNTAEVSVDWQKVASATALMHRFAVISGGPGTGKTSTVVRILALLRSQPGGESLRIALAAPTGMAASRLQRSIQASKSHLPLAPDVLEMIPEHATTLHRLLGVRRQGTSFHHDREHPLALDVLVLDEASMVDVALMTKLFDALPEASRLILLGDKDQLASVEAGAVLGDICQGCEGPGHGFAAILRTCTDEPIPDTSAVGSSLSDNVALLRKSYRFGGESPIGRLAAAVNQGDARTAENLLKKKGSDSDIAWIAKDVSISTLATEYYAALFHQIDQGVPIEQLFELLRGFRVLCALRGGPAGAEQINIDITHRLRQMGLVEGDNEWYPGRPVMITRNDYQLELYNGDTGITLPLPDDPQKLSVVFHGTDGQPRWIPPARLPDCETVFAVTVHKSQGSEFDHVVLNLPDQPSPVLCRELIYTAITRARSRFSLIGSTEIFQQAVVRRLERHSGLSDLLSFRH